ncbi:hypothetical protein [Granulicatella elegans]|uniref:hypothetical protein n=1 Tax=Granulicatella elegans TaxID=137732 RepID=UPI001D14992C|nr:hypothetical protein [Granulicatella elegans]UEA30987.1 hypothetical protein LK443_06830 [Granulicatella elegans]
MGNTIEFPNQEEFYIQKATQCQKEDDLIGAIDWLEKGYIKTRSDQLLDELWILLCRSQDWNEMIWLVEEFELKEEKYLSAYLEALICMNRLEEVEVSLKQSEQLQYPWINDLQLKVMNQKLKNEQEKVQQLQEIGEVLQSPNKNFSVEEIHYMTQVLIDSTLPQKEFVIQLFLIHSKMPMFDKAILLDEWLDSGTLNTIQLLWNGEMKLIERNKLFPISISRLYKEEAVLLNELMGSFSMEETMVLDQKWKQDFIRLHPFQEEYITSFEEWMDYFSEREDLMQSLFYDDATFIKQYEEFRENR